MLGQSGDVCSLLRAGTYLGVPRPPFTPGYELVGCSPGKWGYLEQHWTATAGDFVMR
jgi:hypothetical protein